MNEPDPYPRVFLNYATEDRGFAIKLVKQLEARGVNVWCDLSLPIGNSQSDRIPELISARDYLIMLISPNTRNSDWHTYELTGAVMKELSARDITILPVLIEGAELPSIFDIYQYLDLRRDPEQTIEELVDQISAAPEIDFARLTPERFENLIAELLARLNFTNIVSPGRLRDVGYDIKADYQRTDPFGLTITETWLVECKFYRRSRADLNTVSQFLFRLSLLGPDSRGLLVMNSQLTSAAIEHVASFGARMGMNIRVIDGTELKRLLIKHKGLIRKYFLQNGPVWRLILPAV